MRGPAASPGSFVSVLVSAVLLLALSMAAGLPVAASDHGKTCTREADRSKSVARLWDEALLDAIRRDFPAPTVHSRNLFHVSAAMWDAWAAYDPIADGVFVHQKIELEGAGAARRKAVSYAAYRGLTHR